MKGALLMHSAFSVISITIAYVISLFSAIPAFIKEVKSNPDFSWMVTVSETREVSKEEYTEFYQKNYKHMRASDDYNHPERFKDVTDEYQALMDENLATAQSWKTQPGMGQINFYNSVKDWGVWDYKRPDAHKQLSEDWGVGEKFTVYGVVMDWEILGNLNFSFTGCVVGFTPTTIRTGGGIVNLKNNAAADLLSTLPYYFDEEDDAEWIAFGINLYCLMDPNYQSQARVIDLFLAIFDPRAIGVVYKFYKDSNR